MMNDLHNTTSSDIHPAALQTVIAAPQAIPTASPQRKVPTFEVASTLSQITEAWSLVHDAYQRIGLIDTNPFGLHTITQAIHPDTTVVVGKLNGSPVSTLTMILENDTPIALQKVYPNELDALRSQGKKLLEVGLLADRREHISRAMVSIFEMMRYVFWRAYRSDLNIIAGVHPHHAGFYINSFGFTPIGSQSTHPTVKDHPVLPLVLDVRQVLAQPSPPKRLTQYLNNPLPEDVFEERYAFNPKEIDNTPLGLYLQAKARAVTQVRTAG